MTNYKFLGWFTQQGTDASSDDWGEEFDFEHTAITEGTTLYAKWSDDKFVKYTVDFVTNYGVSLKDSQRVPENEKATDPGDPMRAGKKFAGWWTQNGGTSTQDTDWGSQWDFNSTPVTKDTTLYARWIDLDDETVTHKITFEPQGGTTTSHGTDSWTVEVKDGATIGEGDYEDDYPEAPTREGYTFLGWRDNDNNGFVFGPIRNSATAYAYYVENNPDPVETVTITFDSNGAIEPTGSITFPKGEFGIAPTDPERPGYNFKGWHLNTEDGDEYFFDSPVEENLHLVAQWEEIPDDEATFYNVTFESNGGSTVDTQSVKEGQCATFVLPTKPGYVFAGWFYDDTTFEVEYNFATPVMFDVKLYAKWVLPKDAEEQTHNVTFDPNGGTPTAIQKQVVKNGGYIDRTAVETPTREGYTFIGWFYNNSLKDQINWEEPIYQETSLIAMWAKGEDVEMHTVTWHSNGGFMISGPSQVEDGKCVEKPTNPTRTGYTFGGWYTDESCTTPYDFTTPVTTDLDLYAKWTPKADQQTYEVKFDSRGGTEASPNPQTVKQGDKVVKPAPDPTITNGKTFDGWFTDPDCTTEWDFNAPVTGNMTLYAKWKDASQEVTHTLTFKANGGTLDGGGSTASFEVASGETFQQYLDAQDPSATFEDPTRDGYKFCGWWVSFEQGQAFDFDTVINSNLVVYANWVKVEDGQEVKTYNVYFEMNGGTPRTPTQVRPLNNKVFEPNPEPTRPGYTFEGWYTKQGDPDYEDHSTDAQTTALTSEGSSAAGSGSAALQAAGDWGAKWDFANDTVTADMWLYAKFTENTDKVLVKFETYGGTQIADQELNPGDLATRPDDPKPAEATDASGKKLVFAGWYENEEFSGITWNFSDAVYESKTLYARFVTEDEAKEITHWVNFNTQGGSPIDSQEVVNGEKATRPDDPTKSGYTFVDWYEDAECTVPFNFDAAITNDVTAFAKWVEGSPTLYTVTFDTKGGSTVSSQKVEAGGYASQPRSPELAGSKFAGWFLNEDYSGGEYNFFTPVNSDITIYARWVAETDVTYNLTFESNGGTKVSPQVLKEGELPTKPVNPTREGYVFGGWFADPDCATTPFNFNKALTTDMVAYARWIEVDPDNPDAYVTYNVTFETNGGSTCADQVVLKGETPIQPENPVRAGFTFGGWFADADLTVPFSFGDGIYQDTVVYARWYEGENQNVHKVTFDTQGGNPVTEQWVLDGETATKPANNPVRAGYTFGGWFADAACTTPFNFYNAIYADTTVYARWFEGENLITWNVYFDSKGGTPEADQVVLDGGKPIYPEDPTLDGFNFLGWYKEDACTNAWNWDSDTVHSDTWLYAKWRDKNWKEITTDGKTKSAETGDALASSNMPVLLIALGVAALIGCIVCFIIARRKSRKEEEDQITYMM